MPELTYPHYQIQADGPDETGCRITMSISDGVGGPLPGTTSRGIVTDLVKRLESEDGKVTVSLVLNEITGTSLR